MKKVIIGFILLSFFSVFLCTGGVRAENKETLIIKTGHLNSVDDKIEGTEGMTLVKGDIEINSERGLYYEDEKRAEIEGNVVLVHDKGEISSETLEAWINDDRYVFKDNVTMLQTLEDGEFTLESPYLELMKVDNSFNASQGVVIEYNGRTLKGKEVLYNDQEETLELHSDVYIEEENGDWIESEWALFYLDTEEFTAEGSVKLELDITSD